MHELSVAHSLIQLATEHALDNGAVRVVSLTVKIGALTCVHQQALELCFELASKNTLLEGACLRIEDCPVAIYCPTCQREVELAGIQEFRCPECETLSGDVRRGRELDLETIEIEQHTDTRTEP